MISSIKVGFNQCLYKHNPDEETRYLHSVISNGCSRRPGDTLAEMKVMCLKALVTRATARAH